MAWRLGDLTVVHIPKCGGTWIDKLVDSSGMQRELLGGKHAHPAMIPTTTSFVATFVRHPLDWYRSYWSWRANDKEWTLFDEHAHWHPTWQIDRYCHSKTFEGFIENVLEFQPGFLSYLFALYTDSMASRVGSKVNFVGRQETLIRDVAGLFRKANVPIGANATLKFPRQNVSSEDRKKKALYTSELADRMVSAEWGALDQFDYIGEDVGKWVK